MSMGIARMLAATALLAGIAAPAVAADAAEPPAYRITAHINPGAGTIECSAEIQRPPSFVFSLSSDLGIRRIRVDGRETPFRESPPAPPAASREVTVAAARPGRLLIEYGGPIRPETYPKVISEVNGIRAQSVELAGYVGWYPRLKAAGSFTFHLTVDVPAAFVTVTNGRFAGQDPRAGERAVTEWDSYGGTWDIVVVSAPRLRKAAAAGAGVGVQLYSAALPQDYVDRMKNDVANAVEVVSQLIGHPAPTEVVRVVYSPRPGWGYVRMPLIVVSEASALASRGEKFGPARDLRYITHEIAHCWWHFADGGTPDDWINEGLSEYTAWVAAGRLVGHEFASQLLDEYRERSATSATTWAIAQTPHDSADREVNRYARPVLLLAEAQRKYGTERMTGFIQGLYARFASSGKATTAAFLEEAGARLGPEAKAEFSEALYRKSWTDPSAQRYVYSPKDGSFLGTWTGTLTQAGATHQVVLHLAEKDASLVATLDSPDQGAKDVPVPSVRIVDGWLHLGLGAFGVSFKGVLSADRRSISGDWKQAGAVVSLILTKSVPAPDR